MTDKEKLQQLKILWENLKKMRKNAETSLRSKMTRRYLQQCKEIRKFLDNL